MTKQGEANELTPKVECAFARETDRSVVIRFYVASQFDCDRCL
jgi:hypothetical protein